MGASRWFVLRELARRDVESRYVGSVLGAAWTVVAPFLQLLLFSIVFGMIVRIPVEGEGTSSFPLFLFGGLVPWIGLSDGILRGATALVENAALLGRISVPAAVLIWARVLAALVHQLAATLVLAILGIATGLIRLELLPLLLVSLVIEVLVVVGLASGLAPLVVVFRDLSQGLPLVLQAVFYLSPIIYPVALVPARLEWATIWNPIATMAACHRAVFLGSPTPTATALAMGVGLAALVWILGSAVLSRLAAAVVDDL